VVLLTRREADVTGGRHQSEAGPPKSLPGVAGFKSERWPTSNRNVDRLQAGRVADIKSERVAGLRRNLQSLSPKIAVRPTVSALFLSGE
jgi:hypothetical protein